MFIEQLTEQQKAEQLRKQFGIEVNDDTKKELSKMCNLSSGLKERAEAVGEARGKAIGEESTWVKSVRNLMNSMQLTAQQAIDAVAVPAELRQKVLEQL